MPPSGLLGIVVATALGAARVLPVIWLVAPMGGPRLPAPVRVGFALLLALVAVARADRDGGRRARSPTLSVLRFTLLLAREIVVGLCLGLVASAAFRAAEVAGRLGDTLRGANVAEILVPTAEERASPLGVLYLLLATIVFLQIGGVPRLVEALLSSYRTLPIAGGLGEPRRAPRGVGRRGRVGEADRLRAGAGGAGRRRAVADRPRPGPDRARRAVGSGVLPGPTSQRAARDRRRSRSGWDCYKTRSQADFVSWFRLFAQAVDALKR